MSDSNSGRIEKTVSRQNGPGLWFFARRILEYHGFPEGNGNYQERLVVWLRNRYASSMVDPQAPLAIAEFRLGEQAGIYPSQYTKLSNFF